MKEIKDCTEIVEKLIPLLRQRGFHKVRLTWHIKTQGLTILFSIKKNKNHPQKWYYTFGTGIDELCDRNITNTDQCQISQVFYRKHYGADWKPKEIMNALDYWVETYGNLRALNKAATLHRLPAGTPQKAIQYLLWVDLTKI